MRFAIIAVLLLCTVGCSLTPNAAFVAATDANMAVIGPEYRNYVGLDGTLTTDEKEVRLTLLAEFLDMIDAAKVSAGISEEAEE